MWQTNSHVTINTIVGTNILKNNTAIFFFSFYSNLLTIFPKELSKSLGEVSICTTVFIIAFIKLKTENNINDQQ